MARIVYRPEMRSLLALVAACGQGEAERDLRRGTRAARALTRLVRGPADVVTGPLAVPAAAEPIVPIEISAFIQ
ncbi:MAG TPA: hypothetical protein VFK02_30150 [Kofleriaceae bacterium]|nr:hypothetical protein [Kofleriaceae bacterium]